ncbi:MAG TPA: hypothetical protein VFK59_09480 [Actinomycetota bacterium]|nr:hypothetical protein [Actinomycetota bacterium]
MIASPEAVAFVRERGGRVFVWPLTLEGPTAGRGVFALEASTESPGAGRGFVRFGGAGFDVLIDTTEHGVPEELHLALTGWWRRRLRAYWNGHSFGRD